MSKQSNDSTKDREKLEKEASVLWLLVKRSLSCSKKNKRIHQEAERELFERLLNSDFDQKEKKFPFQRNKSALISFDKEDNTQNIKRNNYDSQQPKRRKKRMIDLHGLNQHDAYTSLQTFIPMMQQEGYSEVLIITGKGLKNNAGIFKRVVPLWLEVNPLRSYVLSYTHASYRFGGEGALVVRLKKIC